MAAPPIYSADDLTTRLLELFPRGWASQEAKTQPEQPNSETSVAWSIGNAIASQLAFTSVQIRALFDSDRLSTATDEAIGQFADDHIGRLEQQPGETPEAFKARIRAALFPGGATRAAISTALERLTGSKPRLIEPWNPSDCGAFCHSYWGVDTVATPFRYGAMLGLAGSANYAGTPGSTSWVWRVVAWDERRYPIQVFEIRLHEGPDTAPSSSPIVLSWAEVPGTFLYHVERVAGVGGAGWIGNALSSVTTATDDGSAAGAWPETEMPGAAYLGFIEVELPNARPTLTFPAYGFGGSFGFGFSGYYAIPSLETITPADAVTAIERTKPEGVVAGVRFFTQGGHLAIHPQQDDVVPQAGPDYPFLLPGVPFDGISGIG